MNFRKFLNVAAVMLSSLAAMVTHGKAESGQNPRKEKKEGELARRHRHHHGTETARETVGGDPPSLGGAFAAGAISRIRNMPRRG